MELRGRNKVSPNFNMSSMTDIVFLLLIFFMLTSTVVTTNALDLLLPTAKGKTSKNQNIAASYVVQWIDGNLELVWPPKHATKKFVYPVNWLKTWGY